MVLNPTPASLRAERTSSPWLVLVLVCLAQFMVVLDATVVNVALPSIRRGLDFQPNDLQWVVNSYTLAFGGFLLLGGRAADLFGRKRLFLVGIAVFSAASVVNALATSPGMLIGGRALQGLGGALVSPAALSIITTTFAEGRERTRALGVWSGIAAGGGAVGLLLGGILTDVASWQWVFIVNAPVGAAGLLLSLRFVPESRLVGSRRHLDLGGALLVTAGLMVAVYAIVEAPVWGWGSGRTIGLGTLAVALLAGFVAVESRFIAPLMPLRLLRVRSLAGSDSAMLITAAGLFAMFFFAGLYVQDVMGYSPLRAGLAFLPVTVGIGAGAALAQGMVQRMGVRNVALVGLGLGAIGLLAMTRISVEGGYLTQLLPGLGVMSVGMGLCFVPVTLMATSNISAEDSGLASGLLNTAQQVGGALGLAILSTLATSHSAGILTALGHAPSRLDVAGAEVDGFRLAFVAAAAMLALAGVLLAFMVRRRDVIPVAAGAAVLQEAA